MRRYKISQIYDQNICRFDLTDIFYVIGFIRIFIQFDLIGIFFRKLTQFSSQKSLISSLKKVSFHFTFKI